MLLIVLGPFRIAASSPASFSRAIRTHHPADPARAEADGLAVGVDEILPPLGLDRRGEARFQVRRDLVDDLAAEPGGEVGGRVGLGDLVELLVDPFFAPRGVEISADAGLRGRQK